jgi:hypothetical protein
MKYVSRLADKELTDRLNSAGAILIKGPKACGKAWTASQVSKSRLQVDVDPRVESYMSFDPMALLIGDTPRLLDGTKRGRF